MKTTPVNARNKHQQTIIQDFLERGEDPFDRDNILKIHDGNGNYNQIVTENLHWYAIKNLWPLPHSENHLVIICKRAVATISELTPPEASTLLEIQTELIKKFSISGGAFCMRFGDPIISGTTCTRLHGHIIKPKIEETVEFYVGQFKNRKKD